MDMEIHKVCVICGKEFDGHTTRQLCCSSECSRKYNLLVGSRKREQRRAEKTHLVKCGYCGKEFITHCERHRFCSTKCQVSYRNARRSEMNRAKMLRDGGLSEKDYTDVVEFLMTPDNQKDFTVFRSWSENKKAMYKSEYMKHFGLKNSYMRKSSRDEQDGIEDEAKEVRNSFSNEGESVIEDEDNMGFDNV